jgi:hypothetical protein
LNFRGVWMKMRLRAISALSRKKVRSHCIENLQP